MMLEFQKDKSIILNIINNEKAPQTDQEKTDLKEKIKEVFNILSFRSMNQTEQMQVRTLIKCLFSVEEIEKIHLFNSAINY